MDVFYALAEPKRRSIVELLASQGELSVSAIASKFHISTAAISQHLKVLKAAKLVRMEKRAQQRIYRLNPESVQELEKWAQETANQWNQRLDNLEKVLALEKNKLKGATYDKH